MEIGTPICDNVIMAIDHIVNVVPARWDGMLEKFVVCEPQKAQGHIIMTENGDPIIIAVGCTNKDALLDIL